VEDATPGLGPAGGFLSALGVAETEYVCVAPCDSPLISPAVYRLLESKAGGRDAAVPKIRGMFEPLHAVYRREPFLKCLEKIVARGGRRPVLAYESMDVCEVDGDELKKLDPRLATFFNVNTKEDLEAAELLLR
jgi:molybdopterin-guanine dinucleotide biosynthesis protein A